MEKRGKRSLSPPANTYFICGKGLGLFVQRGRCEWRKWNIAPCHPLKGPTYTATATHCNTLQHQHIAYYICGREVGLFVAEGQVQMEETT